MKEVQDKVSKLKAKQAQLYNQLSGFISTCRIVEESLKCEKVAYAKTRRTFKELNALIAISLTSPTFLTFPTSPTCRVDLEGKKNIIERLKKVIYKDRKNQGALEQKLTEMWEILHQRNHYISSLEIELRGFQ